MLSNGRPPPRITTYGAGDIQWAGLSLTRWRPDTTRDHWGYWIYLRDEESSHSWPVTAGPDGAGTEEQRVVFFPHKAEFSRRADDLFVRMEICVTAGDDVDIRRLEIQNESNRTRRITVTSYAEIAMADPRSDVDAPGMREVGARKRVIMRISKSSSFTAGDDPLKSSRSCWRTVASVKAPPTGARVMRRTVDGCSVAAGTHHVPRPWPMSA